MTRPSGRSSSDINVRDRGLALDTFHHPYAYAAHYGVDTDTTRPGTAAEFSVAP